MENSFSSIVVTGGAGFIGSNLVRRILATGTTRVAVVDAFTYAGSPRTLDDLSGHSRLAVVSASIGDAAAMAGVLRDRRPSAVLNLAAETHVDRSIRGPRPFLETNVDGTFELLEVVRAYWEQLPAAERDRFRFLHVSTDEVYGSIDGDGEFVEGDRYAPSSPYAASKAAGDHFVRAYRQTYGLPTVLTHCSNNFGPYQFPEKLIPVVILHALRGDAVPLYGDGLHVRDWLFVDDHCEALLGVLATGRVGESYNVASGEYRTNLEVVGAIFEALEEFAPPRDNELLGRKGITRYQDLLSFVPDRPGHDRRYAIDAGKTRREIGWAPRHPFRTALRQTVRWYLDHLDWCHAAVARAEP